MKKQIAILFVFIPLLVLCAESSPLFVRGNFKPAPLPAVHIASDGAISPESSWIQKNGALYTVTDNFRGYVLEVDRSDIILDGAGFSIKGNGAENGITLNSARNVTIANFSVAEVNIGILMNSSFNCKIENSSVTGGNYGIELIGSWNNVISNNNLKYSFTGFWCIDSGDNTLRNNKIIGNIASGPISFGLDFIVTGSAINHYLNDIDDSNTVNGRAVCYWVNRQNTVVPPDQSYIALVNCTNVTVQNQNIHDTQGILLVSTTNSTITDSSIRGNMNGIQILYSTNDTITNNQILNNIGAVSGGDGVNLVNSQFINVIGNKISANWNGGVTCSGSSGNQIIGNAITENHHNGINLVDNSDSNVIALNHLYNHTTSSHAAIYIQDSKDNLFIANNLTDNGCWGMQFNGDQQNNTLYCNNFVNNSYSNVRFKPGTLQISMLGAANPDAWDNGKVGNYWSDYISRYPNASDVNGSGIGNTPFLINQNNVDNYPLLTPFDDSEAITLPLLSMNGAPYIMPTTQPTPPASLPPSPSPTPPESPSASASPYPSPSPIPSPTQQPTPEFAQTPTSTFGLIVDYPPNPHPEIIGITVVAAAAVAGVLVYFKRRDVRRE